MNVPETTFFAIIPEWVLRQASPSAVKLYGLLDRYAGRGGTCWPRREALAESLGCSTRNVSRLVRELETIGALVCEAQYRDDGGQTSNRFYLRRETPTSGGGDTRAEGPLDNDFTPKNESQYEREQEEQKSLVLIHENGVTKDPVAAVYAYWRSARNKTRANYERISPRRRQKIECRLREFSVEDLCAAIDGVARDPWDERHLHDDLTVIFRSQEQVERFLDMRAAAIVPGRVTAASVVARAQESRRRELGQIAG